MTVEETTPDLVSQAAQPWESLEQDVHGVDASASASGQAAAQQGSLPEESAQKIDTPKRSRRWTWITGAVGAAAVLTMVLVNAHNLTYLHQWQAYGTGQAAKVKSLQVHDDTLAKQVADQLTLIAKQGHDGSVKDERLKNCRIAQSIDSDISLEYANAAVQTASATAYYDFGYVAQGDAAMDQAREITEPITEQMSASLEPSLLCIGRSL